LDRDHFMTPGEAVDFGLIDHVLEERSPAEEGGGD
ncbi:MAG: ATP-dependent Clp protease proteolytic subunit, partial [Pseudomonadota bacterium]